MISMVSSSCCFCDALFFFLVFSTFQSPSSSSSYDMHILANDEQIVTKKWTINPHAHECRHMRLQIYVKTTMTSARTEQAFVCEATKQPIPRNLGYCVRIWMSILAAAIGLFTWIERFFALHYFCHLFHRRNNQISSHRVRQEQCTLESVFFIEFWLLVSKTKTINVPAEDRVAITKVNNAQYVLWSSVRTADVILKCIIKTEE